MENRKASYLIIALTKLLNGERLSAIEDAKNSNQYFCAIKNKGIELIEDKKPNLTNRGYHLERRLSPTGDNISRAKAYLNRLKRVV